MVSVSLRCAAVEWRWRVLLLSCPAQQCDPCPAHPSAVLISTAVMSYTVRCRVCGVARATICPRSLCGGVSSVRSPLVVVVGGALWMVGWRDGVGWRGE